MLVSNSLSSLSLSLSQTCYQKVLTKMSPGSIIVHTQLKEAREYYDIEGLHSDPDGSNLRRIPNKEDLATVNTLDTIET